MSCKPIVSIIVPVFNAEKSIQRCIQSILRQTYQNFEILIIDDGCTDDTLTKIEQYKQNSQIKIIHQNNSGVSTARNLGINLAQGKYIGFVDADDTVLPNYLKNLVNAIEEDKDIDSSICGFKIINSLTNEEKYKTNFSKKIISGDNLISHIFDFDGPLGFVWNKLWKTEIIKNNNIKFSTDVTMAEDLIFVIKYLLCARKVNIIDKVDYIYYQNESSLSSTYRVKKKNKNIVTRYNHYKKSGYMIEQILSKNLMLRKAAEANIVQINLGFLRNLNLNNMKKENYSLYKDLRQECIRYKKSYFDSSISNASKKVIYILTIYCSPLMTKIDSLLNNTK